ncbi:DUF461 domain-containing protein [Streptomyces sp. bgisy100]|uniref:DUF461 domain-containing protein n=1 Tax=Streptomyces sp. bgisy100 TaxID=3413783 RepID=UPI003D72107E
MSSSLRRGALAATAIAFSIASLAACGAGNSASTLQVKPDNAATSVGDVQLQNVNVITQPDGAEGPAVVSGRIFNNGTKTETLESVAVEGSSSPVKLRPAKGSGPVTIPAGGSVMIGGKGNASAVMARSGESVRDGNAQQVSFEFGRTGKVELKAFVVPAQTYFKDFGPSIVPTPSSSAKPSGTASPSGSPTGSPGSEEAAGGEAADGDEANGDTAGSPSAEGHEGAGH